MIGILESTQIFPNKWPHNLPDSSRQVLEAMLEELGIFGVLTAQEKTRLASIFVDPWARVAVASDGMVRV